MRKFTTILVALLLVISFLAGIVRAQTTWHVDDDNCPGPGTGTQMDPFCSIQDAINTANDGDGVTVAWGNYNESIVLKNGVWLLGGYDPTTWLRSNGGTSVIDGTGILTERSNPLIWMNSSDITLDGFEITNADYALTRTEFPACSGIVIINNKFHHNNNEAIFIFGLSDTLVINNIFHDNYESIIMRQPDHLTVANNLFYDNPGGLYGVGGLYTFHEVGTVEIINNTFINCGFGIRGQYVNTAGSPWGVIRNNIVTLNGVGISIHTAVDINYNDVWSNETDYEYASVPGPGDISEDPLFSDMTAKDFRLQIGSPCIDSGDNDAPSLPTTDLDGSPRIVDGNNDGTPAVDMGSYEFQDSGEDIPTLSEWGIIIFMTVFLGIGVMILSKRKVA